MICYAMLCQDASILGWCYGCAAMHTFYSHLLFTRSPYGRYTTASAIDVARFYWSLLGPEHSVVSADALRVMETWDVIDEGWGINLKYGAGLELEYSSHVPEWKELTAGIGHAGSTYGFQSINHFFPHLNISMSVTLNSDHTMQKRVPLIGSNLGPMRGLEHIIQHHLVRRGAHLATGLIPSSRSLPR